jgi:hypothetical protein
MALKFSKDEDAIFIGLEAEGRHKGVPTLFIVGNPTAFRIYKALKHMQDTYSGGYSIYIGAGGNIKNPLTSSNLELVLAQSMSFIDVSKIFKLTIESTFEYMVETMSAYTKVLEDWRIYPQYQDWVIPLIWESKEKTIYLKDSNLLQMFMDKQCITFIQSRFNIFGKVYLEGTLLFLTSMEFVQFSDYDNNVAEYITDKLVYSSRKRWK